MELNWSTFLLEIINFLVLVWILKRFLYKPVLDVIARRRADIEDRLAKAQHLHDEADRLKAEYDNRLVDWEHERQQAKDNLSQELNEERTRRLEQLHTTLKQEQNKAKVSQLQQQTKIAQALEHQALQQSAQFATRLLNQASGPELEARLIGVLLENLANLSQDQIKTLNTQWGRQPESIVVASAYPLPENQRTNLEIALGKITGETIPIQYKQNSDLLAGLNITIGAWVLQTNIRDELKGFTEFAYATE